VAGRGWIAAGSITAALGVAIGAFGAHGLEAALKSLLGETVDVAAKSATFETAVRYQMYHALGMIVAGLIAGRGRNVPASIAGWLFLFGVAVFSGLLYALVFGGPSILGAIVPIGGGAMIAGWIALAAAGWNVDAA